MSCLAKAIVSWTLEFLMGGGLLVSLEYKKKCLTQGGKNQSSTCVLFHMHIYMQEFMILSFFNFLIFLVASTPRPQQLAPTVFGGSSRVCCCCCYFTGRPGVLQFMGSQRVEHNWVSDLINNVIIQFFDVVFVPWAERPSILRMSP